VIAPLVVIVGAGIYTVLKAVQPVRWYQVGIAAFSIFVIDLAVCFCLVVLTGGLHSPFLIYSLAPVLTAALLLQRKVTFSIAGLSGACVIGSHLGNPFFPAQLSLPELNHFVVYLPALCLTAVLPYMVNVNLRQRLQYQDMLQERQRLSREIHDGVAQTLSSLSWQVQLLKHRMKNFGIDLNEVSQLEMLATKASQDTRESLELLRSYAGDGSFLPRLRDYLKHFEQDTNIRLLLDAAPDEFHLEAMTELELLCICQEALTNIKKHSKAGSVQVKIKPVNRHLQVNIVDDGCGFNPLTRYREQGRAMGSGLAVMRERAESIGGSLWVSSMPGQGTEVQVEVPTDSNRGKLAWLNR